MERPAGETRPPTPRDVPPGTAAPRPRTATRTATRAALALVLALAAPGGAPAEAGGWAALPVAAARIERAPEFVGRVNEAIDRGVNWLRRVQRADGAFAEYAGYPLGADALVYHTMRVCGVPRDDPAMERAYTALRRAYDAHGRASGLQTYTAALVLMAIAEHGERRADPKSDREVTLGGADRAWAEEVTRWLVRAQNADGTWTYDGGADSATGRRRSGSYDHSNTQYALLGLKAASRCGLDVDAKVWRTSLDHFLSTQDATGPDVLRFDPDANGSGKGRTTAGGEKDRARGWGYVGRDDAYGSMTAGGVGSVVICRSELLGTPSLPKPAEAASETALRDGLAWLGRNFTVLTNPGPRASMAGPGWHYYYLYAVERAGVLAGVDWMADRDWYGEGAKFLCDAQDARGSWTGGGNARPDLPSATVVVDTCFALLFLKKGTMPVRRGALTQAGGDADIRFAEASKLTGRDFEDLIDLVLLRWRRATEDDAKKRLFDGAASVGPRIVEPLLVRMDSPDAEDRAAAHALLRHATGRDFAYDAAAERTKREDAVLQWQAWWLGAKDRLRWDPARRLLVSD